MPLDFSLIASIRTEAMKKSVSDKKYSSKKWWILLRDFKKRMLTKLNECKSTTIDHISRGC
jgi:hypothetical protein